MSLCYLETSALVKVYVREQGTDRVLALLQNPANQIVLLTMAHVELRSAIRRREKSGDIPTRIADHLPHLFQLHAAMRYILAPVTDEIIETAAALIHRHSLRGYDSLQLAGYLVLATFSGVSDSILVCSDIKLLEAAKREGTRVLDLTI